MKTFKESDGVIYTDPHGRQIDTFVVFSTDRSTGLTHINHENLRVGPEKLVHHPGAIPGHHLPVGDAFSFEILRKLKEKHKHSGKIGFIKPVRLTKAS
jgi:hypothetical protein